MHEDSKFREANLLLRDGQFDKATHLYEELQRAQPGFAPYSKWLSVAKQNMQLTGSIESDVALIFQRSAVHPASKPISECIRRIVVVTPVFNGAAFLGDTIRSVFSQEGDFFIDYFVKDGCSGDGTLDILGSFLDQVANGNFPLRCEGIRFHTESCMDTGLYDAVASAFARIDPQSQFNDILTYINADDIYLPGSFRIAANVFGATKARWICGQIHTISATGETISTPEFPLAYAREDIAAGLHPGEGDLYFIQQEGTFWLRELFDDVGGVNPELKLAGDFDLWLRFADRTELLAMDRPLACFRFRPGQLSEQLTRYRQEMNAVVSKRNNKTGSHSSDSKNTPQFFEMENSPAAGQRQNAGPVCFLNDDGTIREIVYLRRAWIWKEKI